MNNNLAGFLVGMLICVLILIAVAIVIQVLFLLNLHRTLNAVRERNREMTPGLVWLTMIPLFGSIWALLMVPKISNSLRREYEDRGRRTDGEGFARTGGMIWAWGGFVSIFISLGQNALQLADMPQPAMIVSLLSLPISIAVLIGFILFWVQTYQYRKRLEEGGRGYASGSLEEDYDDRFDPRRGDDEDRPRRPRDDTDDDRPRRDEPGDEGDRPRRRDYDN